MHAQTGGEVQYRNSPQAAHNDDRSAYGYGYPQADPNFSPAIPPIRTGHLTRAAYLQNAYPMSFHNLTLRDKVTAHILGCYIMKRGTELMPAYGISNHRDKSHLKRFFRSKKPRNYITNLGTMASDQTRFCRERYTDKLNNDYEQNFSRYSPHSRSTEKPYSRSVDQMYTMGIDQPYRRCGKSLSQIARQ